MARTDPEEVSTILGRKAEQIAREKYGLVLDRNDWRDARYQNGTPVSVKAAQPDRRFRLFEESHDVLTSQQGYYVFVCYEPVHVGESLADTRIDVKAVKRKRAVDVTPLVGGWNQSGHERGRQKKLQVEAVFPSEGVADTASRTVATS